MKVEIDLGKDAELTPNAQRAEDRAKERRRLKEYGDTPEDEIKQKEKEKEDQAEEKRKTANPPPPENLGQYKPETYESLDQQLSHMDRQISKNL